MAFPSDDDDVQWPTAGQDLLRLCVLVALTSVLAAALTALRGYLAG